MAELIIVSIQYVLIKQQMFCIIAQASDLPIKVQDLASDSE